MLSREESDEIYQNELNKSLRIFHMEGKYGYMYFLVSGICLLITLIMIIVKSFNNPVALALYSIVAIGCVVAFRIITKFLIPRRGLAAAVLVVFVLIPLRHVIRHSLWGGTYTSTLSVPEIMTFYLFLAWYFISIFVTRRAFEKAQERERNLSYMERESDKKKYDYITRDQVDSIDNSSQREMTLEDEFDNFVPSSNSNAFKSFGAAGMQQKKEEQRFCPTCGFSLLPGEEVCSRCNPVSEVKKPEPPPSQFSDPKPSVPGAAPSIFATSVAASASPFKKTSEFSYDNTAFKPVEEKEETFERATAEVFDRDQFQRDFRSDDSDLEDEDAEPEKMEIFSYDTEDTPEDLDNQEKLTLSESTTAGAFAQMLSNRNKAPEAPSEEMVAKSPFEPANADQKISPSMFSTGISSNNSDFKASPFKPMGQVSSEPSPFKPAAAPAQEPSPFKPAVAETSEASPFKPAPSAASDVASPFKPSPSAEPEAPSPFKPMGQVSSEPSPFKPAPSADPAAPSPFKPAAPTPEEPSPIKPVWQNSSNVSPFKAPADVASDFNAPFKPLERSSSETSAFGSSSSIFDPNAHVPGSMPSSDPSSESYLRTQVQPSAFASAAQLDSNRSYESPFKPIPDQNGEPSPFKPLS